MIKSVYKKQIFISLIYSLCGSLALISVFDLYTMACFHERHMYPYLYPFSMAACLLSIIFCIINIYFDVKNYKNSTISIWKYTSINALIVLTTFIPFILLESYIIDFIGKLF